MRSLPRLRGELCGRQRRTRQTAPDHEETQQDERDAEPLSHIKCPTHFEGLLLGLDEFDEETRKEDPDQSDAEQYTGTAARHVAAVIKPAEDAEGHKVTQRLVNLRRVYRCRSELVHPLGRTDELEAPGKRRGRTEDLGVEEVAHAHDGPAHTDGDHDAVERPDIGQAVLAREEPQADQQADCGAVAGHAAVAEARDDGPRPGEVLHRIVEEAVPEAGSEDRGQRTVDEDRAGDLLRQSFAFAEVVEEPGADQDGQGPHQPVITDIESADAEEHRIEVPDYAQRLYHLSKFNRYTPPERPRPESMFRTRFPGGRITGCPAD